MGAVLYTIGHSTHPIERFTGLLGRHGVSAIADVRSMPYSRRNPQFNRESLQRSLGAAGIAYVFLGRELGARTDDMSCYENGQVKYDRLARLPAFERGLERVADGMLRYTVALMCAERDPLQCHRTILVARHVTRRGIEIRHILADGGIEPHEAAVDRLIGLLRLPAPDMFGSREAQVEDAFRLQGERMAYELPEG